MDNISSADLDSPSKTPLYLGIAAVIVALAGLGLGWLGFSKASALEQQLADINDPSSSIEELQSKTADIDRKFDQFAVGFQKLNSSVNEAMEGVSRDISSVKKNLRSVTIQAGTALKKVEELKANGVKVSAAPAPTAVKTGSSASKESASAAAADSDGVYHIKKGDTFGRLADKFDVSLNALLNANPGVDPRRLAIGQEILIPASK